MSNPIDCRKNIPLQLRLSIAIPRLVVSKQYRRPLTAPTCDKDTPPGLVSREFIYRDGRRIKVTAHAKVMVGYLRALRKAPTLEVTADADSKYSGSYRSWAQQNELYVAYKNGAGHRAASPCTGYHRRGRAFDLVQPLSDREDAAMTSVRVDGQRFFNGADFGDPAHWSFGAHG